MKQLVTGTVFEFALNFAKQLGLPSFLSIQITWVLLMYNERKNCEILIFKIRGGVVFLSRFKIGYAIVVFKISENLVEFKPFETLDKRLFFRKNQLCEVDSAISKLPTFFDTPCMYMTLNYQIKSILNCLSIQYANSVSFFVQLDALPKDEKLVGELRSGLEPYIFEAGLDPDDLHCNGKLLIGGLIMYQVIDKRKPELDELAKGIIFVFSVFF